MTHFATAAEFWMQFATKNKVQFKPTNRPHFVFVKMPVQEHEGEISEEGTRLDI